MPLLYSVTVFVSVVMHKFCSSVKLLFNSLNAKCIYTCISRDHNHLCDACQCCVYYKESL